MNCIQKIFIHNRHNDVTQLTNIVWYGSGLQCTVGVTEIYQHVCVVRNCF